MNKKWIAVFSFLLLSQTSHAMSTLEEVENSQLTRLAHNLRQSVGVCLSNPLCGLDKNETDLLNEVITSSEIKEFIFEYQDRNSCSNHSFSQVKWSVCTILLSDFDFDKNKALSPAESFYFLSVQFEKGTRGVSLVASGLAEKVIKFLGTSE